SAPEEAVVLPEPVPGGRGVPLEAILLPLAVVAILLALWHGAVVRSDNPLSPRPVEAVEGIGELAQKGVLHKYILSSLFRVTWGFVLAVLIGVPFGLLQGWSKRANFAFNPLIQLLRPISPIAWIPLAILWFGLSERAPIFLIFYASFFPITISAMAAVQNIQLVYLRAARNFGLSRLRLFTSVILPATLPQIVTGIRIALGIAWLVGVVARPRAGGLGSLINASRSAGRYALVVAGMAIIGVIGLILDLLVRQLENLDEVRWGYAHR